MDLYLNIANVGAPLALLREVKKRLQADMPCTYLYPQISVKGTADDFTHSHGPLIAGPLSIPKPLLAESLSGVSDSTIVLDLDGLLFAPRYELASGTDFLVPDFVLHTWSDEQRAWLAAECKRLPALSLDAGKEVARALVEGLAKRGNKVILCDAIEFPADPLPEGFATAEELQMALMELNLFARELSAELGVLIMHVQIGVRSTLGGAGGMQTDFRRLGQPCAELLATELQKTLEQIPDVDWFDQERARVEEKMGAQ